MSKTDTPLMLFTSDWHLMDVQPECRTDDTLATQMNKIRQIYEIGKQYSVPIIVAGDIFDVWKPSHKLVARVVREMLMGTVYTIPGQHDLPQHNLELQEKSAYAVLQSCGCISDLRDYKNGATQGRYSIHGFPFGVEPTPPVANSLKRNIAVAHTMCWHKEKPYPGAPQSGNASEVMKRFAGYDIVVCGDNHHGFSVAYNSGRILVNCGTTFRAEANMIDYEPRVWMLWHDENDNPFVEAIPLKVDKTCMSKEHIEHKKARDERTKVFVEKVKQAFGTTLSFKKNVEQAITVQKLSKGVVNMINDAMEGKIE